jgi:hypothetical protein
MKKGEIWGPKDSEDLAELRVIDAVTTTTVTSSPRSGGFLGTMERGKFEQLHELFDWERIARMERSFKPIEVTLDGYDDGFSVPAYTNGQLWNGWQTPVFEKDVLLKHIEAGTFTGPTMRVWFDEEIQTFVTVMSLESKDLPENLDIRRLKNEALSENDYAQVEMKGLGLVEVSIADVLKFGVEGREVVAYRAFDGRCWMPALDPTEEEEMAASPAP